MNKIWLLVLLSVTFSVGSDSPADAAAFTIRPSTWGDLADGGVGPIDGMPDLIRTDQAIIAGYSVTTPEEFHGAMEFDLQRYTFAGNNAFLNLFLFDITREPRFEGFPFQLYGYIGDGRITASDFSGGTLLSSFTPSSLGGFSIDVSSFVNQATTNDVRFLGMLIRPDGDPFINETAYWFGSPTVGGTSSTLGERGVFAVSEPHGLGLITLVMLTLSRTLLRKRDRWGGSEAPPQPRAE
jgi:hypothetical protein